MKDLKQYTIESLLDDEDELATRDDLWPTIYKFLQESYLDFGQKYKYTIDKNGKYIVGVNGDGGVTAGPRIKKLTNDFFEWGYIKSFDCSRCKDLISLEGAPKKCDEFSCQGCLNLESLEGAPKECGFFNCGSCPKLKSLEGAPKICRNFNCTWCGTIKDLKGIENVNYEVNCTGCKGLQSLKGAPKKLAYFVCAKCPDLHSLVGGPREITIYMDCSECLRLKNLKGAPKICNGLICNRCSNLQSLQGISPNTQSLSIGGHTYDSYEFVKMIDKSYDQIKSEA